MCSKSNVNELLGASANSGGMTAPSIAAHKVKKNRDAYFLVDIREGSESLDYPFSDADTNVTMGAICADASYLLTKAGDKQTVVLACSTGERAKVAAESVLSQSPTTKVAVLQRGLVGWENTAAVSPDFLVVLGLGDSQEKLSLALAAVAAGTELHSTVVLVLMSDGVNWFLKPDSDKATLVETANVETVEVGEPFKPCKAMLNKFLTNGGLILACTTCIKHRKYSFDTDMMDCINPMQMPDLVRMLGEAKGGNLQFM